MKFFSWSDSYDHPDFERLLISARRQNIEIEAIGLGQSFRSMLTKNSTLLEAVSPLDEDQIVVSTDGHDVLYFAGIERIRERFLAFRSPIVYAAESMCAHI